jgi:hypothetical protein
MVTCRESYPENSVSKGHMRCESQELGTPIFVRGPEGQLFHCSEKSKRPPKRPRRTT